MQFCLMVKNVIFTTYNAKLDFKTIFKFLGSFGEKMSLF